MKISELVEKLMDIQTKCGDIKVVYPDGRDGFDGDFEEVDTVDITQTNNMVILS